MSGLSGASYARVLKQGGTIKVTGRSVVVDDEHVYPISNISHLGSGDVDMFHIPWLLIAPFFMVWEMVALFALIAEFGAGGTGIVSIFFGFVGFSICAAATIWNIKKPKHRGLFLILNSGHSYLFVTRDVAGIRQVAHEIMGIFERPDMIGGNYYEIRVTGSNVGGSLILGSVGGDVTAGSIQQSLQHSAGRSVPPPPASSRHVAAPPPPPPPVWMGR